MKIRALSEVLEPFTVGNSEWLQFLEWAAAYYLVPVAAALHTALPPALKGREKTEISLATEAEDSEFGQLFLNSFGKRPATWASLERSLGVSRARAKILISEGVLILGSRPPKTAAPKTETRYRYKKDVTVHARAHVEADVLAHLRHEEIATRREILSRWEKAGPALARLVKKEAIEAEELALGAERNAELHHDDEQHELTSEQAQALTRIEASEHGRACLIQGVTGSGKTEIYLRLAERCLEQGKSALLIVPEIGLTPALLGQVRARFGEEAAVLHSALSPGARLHEWWRIRHGVARLVVGVRSAIFAPVTNLGLIVVDEEHDDAYKQASGLRYNARDLALARGALCGAKVILGSATPSSESIHRVTRGKLDRHFLRERATSGTLPSVEIVDLRTAQIYEPASPTEEIPLEDETEKMADPAPLSQKLLDSLSENLTRGEQSILLLNRRGFAPWVLCRTCGESLTCANCAISLTWHRRSQRALCHTCGYQERFPDRCPCCGTAESLFLKGHGTERIVETLEAALPSARVARLDRDTAQGKRTVAILEQVAKRNVDILVGTQMVAKGHDFPNVTLVGVLMADQGLRMPDFRGSERTFQLLTQVAGRAGRGKRPGRVLIQTYNPDHPAIRFATQHDTEGFVNAELTFRERANYPPFCHLGLLEVRGVDARRVDQMARQLTKAAVAMAPSTVEFLGPAPAAIPVVRGKSRVHLVLKSKSREPMRALLRQLLAQGLVGRNSGCEIIMDIDPIHFL